MLQCAHDLSHETSEENEGMCAGQLAHANLGGARAKKYGGRGSVQVLLTGLGVSKTLLR